jgi:hypothetical protein
MNFIARHAKNRRVFNPNKKEDVAEYRYYIKNSQWESGCPFWLDWPYLSIPEMIKDRLVKSYLKM